MKLRTENVGAIQKSIRDTHERIAKDERERAQHQELASRAEQDKRTVAVDASAFDEADQKASRHRGEVERLGMVLESRAADLMGLERRLEHARFAEAYGAVEAAAERRHAAAAKLSTAIANALKILGARDAGHEELEAAIAEARSLCPSDLEFELPDSIDEAEFPAGVDRLAKALREGPRRPLAKSAAYAAKLEGESKRAERGRASKAVEEVFRYGDLSGVRKVPSELLPECLTALERMVDDERKRLSAGSSLSHDELSKYFATLERRLERMRELVASTTTDVA